MVGVNPCYRSRGVWALHGRPGFTCFEALLASTILAVISITVAAALNAGRQQSAVAQKTTYAALIGRALMDEILRFPYGNQSTAPDTYEYRRSGINALSDYNNFTDGPNTIKDLAGNLYPTDYQELVRTVTLTPTTLQPSGWAAGASGELVTVTVTYNGRTLVTLQRFIPPS